MDRLLDFYFLDPYTGALYSDTDVGTYEIDQVYKSDKICAMFRPKGKVDRIELTVGSIYECLFACNEHNQGRINA